MINFNGKGFIYDIFIRKDKLYLVSTYYEKSDPTVCVYVNGVKLTESGRNEYEPVRYFSGKAPVDPNITIRIESPGIATVEQAARAEYVEDINGNMAVATLFKGDYSRIPTYCSYYRTQGVEKFYLYYNGSALPEDIYKAADIEYRCWDFLYWNPGALPLNNPGVTKWAHHAQTTFLTSMYLRNLPRYKWFGLVDLDELVCHPTKTLLECLNTEIPARAKSVTVLCHWGNRIDSNTIRYTLVPLTAREGRMKTFYRSNYIGMCGIHTPKNFRYYGICKVLHLIHYVDEHDPDSSSRTSRLERIIEPTATLVLPPCS